MYCERCGLDHTLYADRKPFTKETAEQWFQLAKYSETPVHPSVKVRICETLTEAELKKL